MSAPLPPYELLDHTADAKFRAYGKTMEGAFAHAIQGMIAIITPLDVVQHDAERPIMIVANTKERLLFDMLDEVLFIYDVDKFLPHHAELHIQELDGKYVLEGMLYGEEPTKISGNLKAITYSDMIIEERTERHDEHRWMLQVVVDI